MVKAKTQEASEKSFDNAQEKKGLGKYLPASIEKKWQEKWTEEGIYRFKLEKGKDNYYNLVELPYPSGDLHLGHWFTFVNADAHARHMKMSGKNVFYPNGFDAFGLPAENAAIKRNIHPQDWTMKNIETMKKQFATMGTMIDWAHEAITCLPEYYKWNQWIFIKMFERGIAYRGKTLSNWCPVDQTVLANEHVENGRCWRCGSVVEQKEVEQWFLKITEYAEELLWPDSGPAARVSHPTSSVASDLRGLDGALTRATRGIVDAFDNCIIVHGCPQSEADLIPKENRWMNWLEKELVARGGKAVALEMPKPWEPKYSEWKKALEKQNITKDTILIGHSCGAAFLIRWLLETKRKVKKLILVAPAKLPDPNGDKRIELYNFELPKKVAKVANETAIFISNDDQRHLDSARLYANALGARIVELKDKKHFVYRQTGFYEFPELLEEVLMQKKRENWGPGDVDWPKSVREGQNNWIGRSQGLIFTAPVKDSKLKIQTFSAHFEAFCADTFVVIAPDHPFLKKLIADVPNKKEILDFSERLIQERLKQEHTEGKTMEGIFTGRYIVDPVNGDDLPIWVASFALRDYGTGIVKCSAHDERDFAFAKKYGIKLHPVLFPKDPDLKKKVENLEVCYTDMVKGYLSEPEAFAGKKAGDVREDVINYVQEKGYAKPVTQYHLHDWSVSRQRYWGTPVPMIHCEKCGIVPVPLEDLPVELPYEVDYTPKGKPPLATADEWLRVKCPKCGGEAKRDAETLDTFFDSSWYYYRYTDPKYTKAPFNPELVKGLMPVDIYFGGAEHTLGHTLYARFFTKFFKDLGLIEFLEFAKKRIQHGVILGPDG
ncbi:MAG: class I tRNA ligase family protein, partial [Candidatus Levybacteria bacterium]|nr:class I tRNA ligase family protein [Candidatus Levybacteria bacterium]